MLKLLFSLVIMFMALNGCNSSSSGPEATSPFPIRFSLDSTLQDLTPDSLFVKVSVGDDSSKILTYNWKTGTSRGTLSAKEGQAFKVHFEIMACDFTVGVGDDSGVFEQNKAINLHVKWDSPAIAKAKQCRMGACIPPDLKTSFDLALAGKTFEFPASCDSGATYRWFVKRGDSTLFAGEGPNHSFVVPDSLQGLAITVRVQVVVDGKVSEERILGVKVIARISEGRLLRMRIKNDPSSTGGTSLTFSYDAQGRVATVNTYDTLSQSSSTKAIATDSMFYDIAGRVARSVATLPDGNLLDSIFRYNDSGRLVSLRVKGGSSEIMDSLEYQGNRPGRTLRYVSGVLRDSVIYHNGTDSDLDSIFSPGSSGRELVRVIQNLYRQDSLIQRRVWVNKGGLSPYMREVVVYNGIGKRGYHQVFTEGQSLLLEKTDRYGYDSLGRLESFQQKDETTQAFILSATYEYLGAQPAAKRSAGTDFSQTGLLVLGDLRFAYEGWKLTGPHHGTTLKGFGR